MARLRYLFAVVQAVGVFSSSSPRLVSPTGPYAPGIHVLPLTDTSRREVLANSTAFREILLSIHYPAHVSSHSSNNTFQYMPPPTALALESHYGLPNGTFQIDTNSHPNASLASSSSSGCNVLLFSPGIDASRLVYTNLAEELASHGYVVVSIDHPYDAAAVTFPDGRVVLGNTGANTTYQPPTAVLEPYCETRVADAVFVTHALASLPVLSQCRGGIAQVGIFGHSFGGATTAGAMAALPGAFAGGVNLDGAFFGTPAAGADLQKPFLMMGHPGHSSATDDSWVAFRAAQTGWQRELSLNGSQHLAYSDAPALAEALDWAASFPAGVLETFVGTMDSDRAVLIQRTFVKRFFDFAFGGTEDTVLDAPSSAFPEVIFVGANSTGY